MCDAKLRIRDIVAHWRGSTHDSRIFRESRIKARMEAREFKGRLLGDSGYMCTEYLFTPLRAASNAKEEAYNRAHIRTRGAVERCFGLWKQRFRSLLVGCNTSLENTKVCIVALAVLHNMAINMKEGTWGGEEETSLESEQPAAAQVFSDSATIPGRVARSHFIETFF